MDRELASALTDLGLTAIEAEIYVALLAQSQDGPVSAYKVAQDMGRDPANMTKTLSAMAKRGAVRASGRKPRLYQPVAAADFTGELVAHLQARQRQAVELLENVGKVPDDVSLRPLETTAAALDVARRLLGEARRVVLVDASPDMLGELSGDLQRLVTEQGASVLVRSTEAAAIPGVRVWVDPDGDAMAPGPWLRLAVDGRGYLEAVVHPDHRDTLLHGHWSRNPSQAYLGHRNLGADLILADVMELLREGAGGELVRRRAEDQASLILRQVSWRNRWRESGLGDYAPQGQPVADESVALDPTEIAETEIAETMAELAAETEVEPPALKAMAAAGGSTESFEPETPGTASTAETAGDPEDEDDPGPLNFIFRRRKKS